MKCFYKTAALIVLGTSMALLPMSSYAGNEDRVGSAGGTQLLINPWARSSGIAGADVASAAPVESMFLNVAGMAFTPSTEIEFTNINWFTGSDISINSVGIAQRVGVSSVLGLSVTALSFGDIRRTTADNPEGTGATFSPTAVNIGLSYAKEFSNSIYGGITLKVLSESITDVGATGVAFDAGIRYVTGPKDNIKLGIALKNVGPPIAFEGEGLTFQTSDPTNYEFTAEQRSENHELPSLVSIGGTYDFYLTEEHVVSPSLAFTANSFSSDQYIAGIVYSFKRMFYARVGYEARKSEFVDEGARNSALEGLAAGAGLELPLSDGKTRLSVDYAYRTTMPFDGVHCIGARISLGNPTGEAEE